MKLKQTLGVVLAGALAMATPVMLAQTAGQDMKAAGHDTKRATVNAGHGIAHGTRTATHKTAHATRKGYHKTTRATRNLGRRIEGKPTLPNNPQ